VFWEYPIHVLSQFYLHKLSNNTLIQLHENFIDDY
jgi:hypothetical protein